MFKAIAILLGLNVLIIVISIVSDDEHKNWILQSVLSAIAGILFIVLVAVIVKELLTL